MVDYNPASSAAAQTLPLVDLPSTATPITAAWLNHIDDVLEDIAGPSGRISDLEDAPGGGTDNVLTVINVKTDHNAAGDGVTDDATEIQAALTAAGSDGGGIVYLPPGTYVIAKYLLIPSGVTLLGAGMGVSTIKSSGSTFRTAGGTAPDGGGYSMLQATGGSRTNIVVRDLTVDGNESADRAALAASGVRENSSVVDLRDVNRLTFDNVEVKNGWFWHLTSWNSTDITVRGCKVAGPGTTGTYDQLDGIHLASPTRAKITDCFVDTGVGSDGDDGIAIHIFPGDGDATDVVIANCVVRGGFHGSGIDLANSDGTIQGVTITGCIVRDCVNEGIVTNWFSEFTGSTQDVVIVGNVIRDCGDSIVIGDIEGNDAPHKNIVVTNNLCSRSGGLPSHASPNTNADDVNIENNYTGG